MPAKKDRLLTAKQAAELLGISASAVHKGKCGTAVLTRVKLSPKCHRWSEREVLEFLQRQLELARAEKSEPVTQQTAKVIQLRRTVKPALTWQEIDDVYQEVLNRGTK